MKNASNRKVPKKPMPFYLMILLDFCLIGIALLVFAYFHHVRPREEVAVGMVSMRTYARPTAALSFTPAPTNTPVPTMALETATMGETAHQTSMPTPTVTLEPTPVPTPEPVGYFGSIHKDKFTSGEVISEKDRYVSENVSVTVTKHTENGVVYYLADIYIRDISSFKTLFAEDKFGKGYSESTYKADIRSDSILTISGDEVAEVTFKYYDNATGEEVEFNNSINYSNDAIVGSIEEPYMLTRGTTGIGEASLSEINIYPNPTTTGTEINLQATCDKVEVFNALGVKVAEYHNVDSLDAFETAGIYVIRLTNNGDVKHCRLVVK